MSEENAEVEVVEEVEQEVQTDVDPAEVQARSNGWVDLDEWTEQGKDVALWTGYKRFNDKGDLLSQIHHLKNKTEKFEKQLSNNNEFWQLKIEQEKAALTQQRDKAFDEGDKQAFKSLDEQLNSLNQQEGQLQTSQAPAVDPADMKTETDFINGLSIGQQPFAQKAAQPYIAQGLSGQALVDKVKIEIDRAFPQVNSKRSAASMTESKRPAQSKDDGKLTIDTIGKADKELIATMKNSPHFAKMSDVEILKTLQDSKL